MTCNKDEHDWQHTDKKYEREIVSRGKWSWKKTLRGAIFAAKDFHEPLEYRYVTIHIWCCPCGETKTTREKGNIKVSERTLHPGLDDGWVNIDEED